MNNHKLISIGGVSDHIHVFFGYKPHQTLPDLMKDIKGSSSKWINSKNLIMGKFKWQEGYGAFSYSHSQIAKVSSYIQRQEEHHRKITFREEYLELLEKNKISYDEKYIFRCL